MKRIILSMAVMLTLGATAAFAGSEGNKKAQQVFQEEFKGAEQVKWTEVNEYSKVNFVLAGHRTEAWFSADGELLGTIRDIFYNQLPVIVMRSLDKEFSGADIIDLRETTGQKGTRYNLTIEKEGKKFKVSVAADGDIVELKKLKK
jgi:hypothetical protein